MAVITISRQLASYGDEIAESLASRLGWPLFNREKILSGFFDEITNSYELRMLKESAKYMLTENGHGGTYLDYIKNRLYDMAKETSFVIVGFGSQSIFKNYEEALHFRIVAPEDERIRHVKKKYNVDDEEAEVILKKSDKKRKKFVHLVCGEDVNEPSLYHAIFSTGKFTAVECVNGIMSMYKERHALMEFRKLHEDTEVINNVSEYPDFKTESEREFAKILDMYNIDWRYEPKTFPIEWDDEGNVVKAFSPDFYLTKFDTYIELTTMNQKYVTEKNKKVKRLQKLYPGTNVRIVYKKDFHSLVERFKDFQGT